MESALQSLTLTELKDYRAQALTALAALHGGARQVSTSIDGRRQDLQPGEVDKLERWIGQLQAAIRAKEIGRPARSPIYVRF